MKQTVLHLFRDERISFPKPNIKIGEIKTNPALSNSKEVHHVLNKGRGFFWSQTLPECKTFTAKVSFLLQAT